MAEKSKSWVQKKKIRERVQFLFIVAAVAIIGGIFLKNNSEIFFSQSESSKHNADSALVDSKNTYDRRLAAAGLDSLRVSEEEVQQKSVALSVIRCQLANRSDMAIFISLSVFFQSDSLEEEILSKRKELRVLVQRVIARKKLDEILTNPLRREIKNEFNSFLERGEIEDIVFKDFRIEKVID